MCLYSAKKLKQEDDIRCYKLLMKTEDGELISPFFADFKWEIGETKAIDHKEPEYNKFGWKEEEGFNVSGGSFHTLKTKLDGEIFYTDSGAFAAKVLNKRYDKKFVPVLVECIIPADSEYTYEGTALTGLTPLHGYASQKLKVVKIVKE